MRVFKDVGLVEQLGSGMSRILKVYNRDIFDISENFIKVTFRFDGEKTSPKEINKTQSEILELIGKNSGITQKELAEHLNITVRAVKLFMKKLEEMGMIKRQGSARKGKWIKL